MKTKANEQASKPTRLSEQEIETLVAVLQEQGATFEQRMSDRKKKNQEKQSRGKKLKKDDGDDPRDEGDPTIFGEKKDGSQVTAELRAVCWLWNTTLPEHLNPFGNDGDRSIPDTWPGDALTKCRQWHGIDLGFDLQGNVPINIKYDIKNYVGNSSFCGVVGRGFITDTWYKEPVILQDQRGTYVEVKSLQAARLGVYIPDIEVGHDYEGADNFFGILFNHFLEEIVEYMGEETYTGTDSDVPKIYDFIRLKLYTDGHAVGEYVADVAGYGFEDAASIIETPIGYSWVPEHHLYLDDSLVKSIVPASSDGYEEWVKWIDSWLPAEVAAHTLFAEALIYWCRNATSEQKAAYANTFKTKYPEYFVSG